MALCLFENIYRFLEKHVCSTNRWTLLEKTCLFDKQIPFWKIVKKVAPEKEKKKDIMKNRLSGCLWEKLD